MIFSIVVALMVILVTAFWVYQGFFSSALMFFCTVTASLLAFGFYEQVHSLWAANLSAGLGLPLALMLIFLLTLLVLRLGTDKMIPDGVKLPIVVDRAGGGVCGFFTGMILVGTSLVAIQMLPIGSNVLGFERITMAADGTPVQNSLMLKPDAFTVGLVNTLSAGSFKGDAAFSAAKPDFLIDLYSARDNPQAEERVFVPPDSLKVDSYWTAAQIDEVKQKAEGDKLERLFETVEAAPNNKFLVCRVRLDNSAAAEGGLDVRFRVPQFRVVGPPPSDENSAGSSPKVFLACGLSDLYTHKEHGLTSIRPNQAARLVRFSPQTDFLLSVNTMKPPVAEMHGQGENAACSGYWFDVAFEVPDGFQPWYVEFKRGARVELTKKLFKDSPPPGAAVAFGSAAPKSASPARSSESKQTGDEENESEAADESGSEKPTEKPKKVNVGKGSGGNVHIANAINDRSGAFDDLPIALSKSVSFVAQSAKGDKLDDCHFYVDLPDKTPTQNVVKKFLVPEGKKLVQIGADKREAYSLFGKALNFAANVAAQVRITDSNGNNYFAIGMYCIAPIKGKNILEIQYHPEAEQPERCLQKPKRLTDSVLRSVDFDKRMYGFLFIVEPGVTIVSFSAGARNGATQKFEEPLVVPKE